METLEYLDDPDSIPGMRVVPRTVDAEGNPYLQDEADLAVPLPKPGDRIVLVDMPNDPLPIEPGTEGTVRGVNENVGQIDVEWDNGRGLFLLIGVDEYRVLS